MKNKKFQVSKLISLGVVFVIFFTAAYTVIVYLHLMDKMEQVMRYKAMIVVSLFYCLFLYILLHYLEALRVGQRRLLDLMFGFFGSSFLVNLISFIIGCVFFTDHWKMILLCTVEMTVFQTACGLCWILYCHRIYEKNHFSKEAVFIYGMREDQGEYKRITNTIQKYFRISKTIHFMDGEESVLEQIQDSSIVFIGDIPVHARNVILKYCMKKKIDCYSIPKISDIYIQNANVLQLNDKFLLQYPRLEIEGMQKFWKRCLDLVVAILMLVCFSPVMLVIALAIKKEDGGKILYAQERVTMDGKKFLMYKFRSMHEDAEKGGAMLARKEDDRITKVGHVIRNLHFDELPQLIHVLRGDMSLVGPRPERQVYIDAYADKIPEFAERLKVKAGLTGYAQVYGRYNTVPEDKIKYDLYYIYNYSFWLDLKILVLTFRILFQKENTEGVDEGEWMGLSAAEHRLKEERENDIRR